MNPFTRAVVRTILREAEDSRETVRLWLAEETDLRRMVRRFARQLRKDFREDYRVRPGAGLAERLIVAGLRRVNWKHVALALVRRFAPRRAWELAAAVPSAN